MHSFFIIIQLKILVSIIMSSLGHGVFSHVFNAFFKLEIFFEALSSVVPFSSCLKSFPALGSFLMSWLFASGGPKYWDFSFIISPSSEYSGLFTFRIDWFDILAVQGTLKSLLQHHSSKASITENQPKWSHGSQPCLTQWNYEPCFVGPPKMDGSW